MADNRISMPSGGGGIVRYFDDYKSKFQLKPGHVVFMIIIVLIFEIILHLNGATWFGLK